MTIVSLIVVTTDSVLVADGQGSDKDTAIMVDEIKGLPLQPIKCVVVCSDHGDHTNVNAAFKASYPDVVTEKDQARTPSVSRPQQSFKLVIFR